MSSDGAIDMTPTARSRRTDVLITAGISTKQPIIVPSDELKSCIWVSQPTKAGQYISAWVIWPPTKANLLNDRV
ncbi:hypothetical protein CY34DRAFT_800819 [Suillus luteus UH-Slu-Lm8-n1]|uniref:Uncharacterized protein n=1 Tax=Suillus luteus UH-Slu-Lm8-n1 TaxID=930992 RepID=A0A0D0A7P4_9AGAM|nr:hypothetical protein CY34DRAFT_800819 [Suillus luteus UH-Slu-Lm8-n1]